MSEPTHPQFPFLHLRAPKQIPFPGRKYPSRHLVLSGCRHDMEASSQGPHANGADLPDPPPWLSLDGWVWGSPDDSQHTPQSSWVWSPPDDSQHTPQSSWVWSPLDYPPSDCFPAAHDLQLHLSQSQSQPPSFWVLYESLNGVVLDSSAFSVPAVFGVPQVGDPTLQFSLSMSSCMANYLSTSR